MMKRLTGVATLVAAGAAAVAAVVVMSDGPSGKADPNDPRQVAFGKSIYEANCASCHGSRLEGQPDWRTRKPDGRLPAPPHDAEGHTWHHPDGDLFGIVKKGITAYAPPDYQSDMPTFGGTLSDEEIWAVLSYIKSNWPAKTRAEQQRRTEAARK
jgi:mono/diheme cytochrome c family protein